MIDKTEDISPTALKRYDAILDVRSPGEFAEDHLPGAVNLPVLNNEERAEVGTTYVQTSRFLARRIGAAKVARNIAYHLEVALADKPSDFHPLVYCWRGGQRSGAMATILSQVGWRVTLIDGGYKRWRRAVVDTFKPPANFSSVVLIDGQSGSGKTALLKTMEDRGAQVLDLEGAANHRGSVFGGFGESSPQPQQKLFESRLYAKLSDFDPVKPIFVEAESSLIGNLHVPQALWRAMVKAKRIEVHASLGARTDHILETYTDILGAEKRLDTILEYLQPYQPRPRVEQWHGYVRTQSYRALVAELLETHYDPLYSKGRLSRDGELISEVTLDAISAEALTEAAEEIIVSMGTVS